LSARQRGENGVTIEQEALWAVLTLANEDYSGLYQAIGEMEAVAPSMSERDRAALADSTLRKLIAGGLVYLRQRRWHSKPEEETVVGSHEVAGVLSNPMNWQPPDLGEDECICIVATEKGIQAWCSPNPN
jgi:hypothetical protein